MLFRSAHRRVAERQPAQALKDERCADRKRTQDLGYHCRDPHCRLTVPGSHVPPIRFLGVGSKLYRVGLLRALRDSIRVISRAIRLSANGSRAYLCCSAQRRMKENGRWNVAQSCITRIRLAVTSTRTPSRLRRNAMKASGSSVAKTPLISSARRAGVVISIGVGA